MVIYKLSHEDFAQFTQKLEGVEDFKFEYVDGSVFPLQGGKPLPSWYIDYVLSEDFPLYQIKTDFNMAATKNHDTIISNIHALLKWQTKGTEFAVYSQGTNIYIEVKNVIRVPDVVVANKKEQKRNKMNELLNPRALFEVFSKSTKKVDKTEKLEEYKSIETVEEYVMIAQNTPYVNVNRRMGEARWEEEIFTSLNDTLSLVSLGVSISLSDIYEDVDWNEKE